MTKDDLCPSCGFLVVPGNDPRWHEWEEFQEADRKFDHGEFSASRQEHFPPFCICCEHNVDWRLGNGCEACYEEMLAQ